MALTLYSFTRVVRELTLHTPKLMSLALSLSVTFSVHFSSFCVRCWINEVLFTSLISGSCEGAKKCFYPALSQTGICIYRWIAVSAGNTFQDVPRVRKTADNTERCM